MSKILKSAKQIVSGNSLLRTNAYINGKWVKSSQQFAVLSPSTRETLCDVTDVDVGMASSAINAASDAFKIWKEFSCKERSSLMNEFYGNVLKYKEELAQIMSAECGKPIKETRIEANYAASFLQWFSEEAKRTYGDVLPEFNRTSMGLVIREPVGVVGLITPWNFPLAMITRKLGATIAVGCTAVIKPSEETPLTALALAAIAEQTGIPHGVVNVLPCSRSSTPEIGQLFCEKHAISKVSFTGSTDVGKILLKQSSNDVKRVSMELGGNAPFVVFDSADITKVKRSAQIAKFRGNGQTCVAANRFIVQSGIHERFIEEMKDMVEGIEIGDPFDENTELSSLINEKAVEKVESHVQDAIKKGAKAVSGCERHPLGPTFYKPSILDNCTEDMMVMSCETFGPVMSVKKFETEEEAVEIMSNSRSGLAGYLFSEDMSQAIRVSKKMEVGMVGVNEGAISNEMIPFGGVKESGLGREGSKYGVDDYTEIKYICLGGL